jgi:hypothetical protein
MGKMSRVQIISKLRNRPGEPMALQFCGAGGAISA